MVFSTVHRSKGMEYDSVVLEDDFVNEKRIKRLVSQNDLSQTEINKLNEEVNAVYVGITRAKSRISISDELFERTSPQTGIDQSPQKVLIRARKWKKLKAQYAAAYQPWRPSDDLLLKQMYSCGNNVKVISAKMKRNPNAVSSRLKKLGLR